jgi:hypothetical protein
MVGGITALAMANHKRLKLPRRHAGNASGAARKAGADGSAVGPVRRLPSGIRSHAAPGGSDAFRLRGNRRRPRIHHGADVQSADAARSRPGRGHPLTPVTGRRPKTLNGSGSPRMFVFSPSLSSSTAKWWADPSTPIPCSALCPRSAARSRAGFPAR